jgi:hypothetical protein
MKRLLFLVSLIPSLCFSQTTLKFNYTEVCSEEQRQMVLKLDPNSNSYSFFGESKTFTDLEIIQGEPMVWLAQVYRNWSEYYPCAEIRDLVTSSTKSSSENSKVDVNAPIVVVQSDFGYQNSNFITSGGFSNTDILTNESDGYTLNASTSKVGTIGYYRVVPLKDGLKSITNTNIIFFQDDVLGSLTTGLTLNKGQVFAFIFNAYIFGNLNGYGFQDSSVLLGLSRPLLELRTLELSTLLLTSYTYRVKVFKLDYWFEDYVNFSPYINLTYRVTPTFGLNLSYTQSFRTDMYKKDQYGILLGGRVFF